MQNLLFLLLSVALTHADTDPYLWLEDAQAPAAVAWADNQNKITQQTLQTDPRYAGVHDSIRELVFSPDRLPAVTHYGGMIYNFWQDQAHPHGIYRRTTPQEFAKKDPAWEVLFDLDALSATEKTNWVWKGANCLEPKFDLCFLSLSKGGKDASVTREYDIRKKAFVAGGFELPEAKSDLTWIDANNVLVATDFGPQTLTKSGYARILKRWRRGDSLANAKTILEVSPDDMTVGAFTVTDGKTRMAFAMRASDFDHRQIFRILPDDQLELLPIPEDASVAMGLGGFVFILTKSPWTVNGQTFNTGSLLAWKLSDLKKGTPYLLFAPTAKTFLSEWQISKGGLYVSFLNNVQAELLRFKFAKGKWTSEQIQLPPMGTVSLSLSHERESTILLKFQSFLTPTSYLTLGSTAKTPVTLKSSVSRFNADNFTTEQFESTSKDGTKIPYFLIHAKNWQMNSANPTVLYGYGGFEDSQTPFYSGSIGRAWLEKGGVFVLANIRGGSEFGPAWHTSVLKENRQKVFDDFISVAEDLIARKVTSPARLGIQGGSNGGLLVGATFVQRPDLFGAVVCEVPLLDMVRYPLIGAGASWQAEYGDPQDPVIGPAILKYSPYQNVVKGVHYPKVLFTTSRTDDRVGPAHARKMAAKMQDFGADVLFFEDPEGGHSGADNLEEIAMTTAMTYTYLYQQLMP